SDSSTRSPPFSWPTSTNKHHCCQPARAPDKRWCSSILTTTPSLFPPLLCKALRTASKEAADSPHCWRQPRPPVARPPLGVSARATSARIGSGAPVLVRAESGYCSASAAKAARDAGADGSITVRMDKRIKAAIGSISDDAWTGIEYPEAIYDEDSGAWISKAEV